MSGVTMDPRRPPGPERARRVFLEEGARSMRRAMVTVQGEWQRRADRGGARRTGSYIRSITYSVTPTGTQVVGQVGSGLFYVRLLEEGTGLYGPRHRYIVPVKARALRWPAGGGHVSDAVGNRRFRAGPGFTLAGRVRSGAAGGQAQFVFATRVRGIRPRRFGHDAVLSTQGRVEAIFREGGQAAIARLQRAA